jgi:hypothetical protein
VGGVPVVGVVAGFTGVVGGVPNAVVHNSLVGSNTKENVNKLNFENYFQLVLIYE